ncbi:uncharacterized protein LOC130933940 [Arachis stenosperma]|uniref:uncharacterized protein LOC130933940 n=1 Tax=Arachis stenosperma TaxID=217475 RepID=UPI0025AC5524|nr:uncharacterized protein LOC130933940 [Arachis stenosperma]
MAEPQEEPRKVLGDFNMPTSDFYGRSITVLAIGANNFELKPQLVFLLQQNCKFHGFSLEDPHQFLAKFLQIYDTVKTNEVNLEVYKLMLFPFALRDRAKNWLDAQPKESLDSWERLVNAILAKFFPPQKMSGNNQEASLQEEAYYPDQPTMEEVNYMGEPYVNTYNPSWRNHPNLSWKDQQKPQQGFNQGGRNQNRFNNIPPFPSSHGNIKSSKQRLSDLAILVSSLTKATHSFINETRSSIRNLEVQVGQLSKRIPEIPPDTLPSNIEVNPREECKAITMELEAELEENGKCISFDDYSSSSEDEDTREEQVARYLRALIKSNAKLFATKPLKEEPPMLTKELHALVQQGLPQKLPDPGRFLIPCTIGTMTFAKALCDIGSSINLMPLSVMEKLGILKVQPAHVSLEMANNTMKKP